MEDKTKYCSICGILKTFANTFRDKSRRSGLHSYCKACSGIRYREATARGVERDSDYSFKVRRPCRFAGCDRLTGSSTGYCLRCMGSMLGPLRKGKQNAAALRWSKRRNLPTKHCLGCGNALGAIRGKNQDFCKVCYPLLRCKISYCSDCGGAMRPDRSWRCLGCRGTIKERRAKRYALADSVRRRSARSIAAKYKGKLKSVGCVICSYNRDLSALEFHHLFGKKGKELSGINHITSVNKEIERNPVVVLCANCHRELHSGLVDEGRLVRYRIQPHRVQVSLFKPKEHQARKKGK